jgi:hypothetical protein
MLFKNILMTVILTLMVGFSEAQQEQGLLSEERSFIVTSFIVNSGARPYDVVPSKDQFHYKAFKTGKILYRDGIMRRANMNYNFLTDEMHFISPAGDTMAITNEHTIRWIAIGTDSFYYNDGYLLILKSNSAAKLGVKQYFTFGDKRMDDNYTIISSVSPGMNFTSLNDKGRMYIIKIKEKEELIKVTEYYIGNKYNQFVSASYKNLIELFPESAGVKEFVKNNHIRYDRRADLEKIISFMENNPQSF